MPTLDLYGHQLRFELAQGDAGVMQTLAAMWAVIDDAARSPIVQRVAAGLRQSGNQLQAVYDWIVDHVEFARDPWHIEHLRHPEQLIVEAAQEGVARGDCDDVAMLGASLLRWLEFEPVLIVVGRFVDRPYEHVFFGEYLGFDGSGRRLVIAMDPQQRVPIGQWPPGVVRTAVFGHPRSWGYRPLDLLT